MNMRSKYFLSSAVAATFLSLAFFCDLAFAYPGWKLVGQNMGRISYLSVAGVDSCSVSDTRLTTDGGITWQGATDYICANTWDTHDVKYIGRTALANTTMYMFKLPVSTGASTENFGRTWSCGHFPSISHTDGIFVMNDRFRFTEAVDSSMHMHIAVKGGRAVDQISSMFDTSISVDIGNRSLASMDFSDPKQQCMYLELQRSGKTDTLQWVTIDGWKTVHAISPCCRVSCRVNSSIWIGVDGSNRVWRTDSLLGGWKPTLTYLPAKKFFSSGHTRTIYALLADSAQYYGRIASSTDLGDTWTTALVEQTDTAIDVAIDQLDDHDAWLGTSSGNVYHTLTAGVAEVQQSNSDRPAVALFPNPSRNSVTVSVPRSADVRTVVLITLLGKQLRTRELRSGEKECELDLSLLPSGPFWVRVGNNLVKGMKP